MFGGAAAGAGAGAGATAPQAGGRPDAEYVFADVFEEVSEPISVGS